MGMLDKRGVEISAKIDEAGELLSQAEAQMEEYRTKFGDADTDAAAIIEQAKGEASRLSEKAGSDLGDLLERRSAAFDQRMSQLQVQAQNDLKSRAAELAIGALRKSLPEQLDAAALASLADSAIDDLPNRV
jgi:F-type H+-transporting ATPase subunit b